jgi:hypothetical protein
MYSLLTNLKKYFGDEETAKEASIVCNRESGGVSNGKDNKGCLEGTSPEYSVGLFQINTIFESRCPGGIPAILNYNITPTPPPPLYHCQTNDEVDPDLNKSYFEICREYYRDPDQNIKYAAKLYNDSGKTWKKHWKTDAIDCNLR